MLLFRLIVGSNIYISRLIQPNGLIRPLFDLMLRFSPTVPRSSSKTSRDWLIGLDWIPQQYLNSNTLSVKPFTLFLDVSVVSGRTLIEIVPHCSRRQFWFTEISDFAVTLLGWDMGHELRCFCKRPQSTLAGRD